MNVVAFRPAASEADGSLGPRLSVEHLRTLAQAIGFSAQPDVGHDFPVSEGVPADLNAPGDCIDAGESEDNLSRNYLVTTPGTQSAACVTQLVNLGLMELAAGPMWRGQYVHTVTDAGRQLIQDFHRALFAER